MRKLMMISAKKKQSIKKSTRVQPSDQASTNAVRYGSTRAMKKMRIHAVPSHHSLDKEDGAGRSEHDGQGAK